MSRLRDLSISYKQFVAKSWDQCTAMAIDPELKKAPKITKKEFLLICQKRKHLLLQISQPIVNKFSPFFDYSKYIIILADENGIILFVNGNPELIKEGLKYAFDIGACWTEESVGTNAIGNCLALGQPICVVGEEHFVKQWRAYACAASPIRDPFSGEIIGVLNLTCHTKDFHIFSLGIVQSLTDILEGSLRNISNTRNYNKHGLIMEQFLEASKEADQQDGIVAIDLNGEILAANKIIHSILSNKTQMPFKNLFHYDPNLRDALSQSKATSVSFSTKLKGGIHGRNNTYLVNCVPIFNNEKVHEGWIGRILQISSGSGNDGTMAASPVLKENPLHPIYISSAMSRIVNRARKVASFASTKLILGESGVGKEILAKFIHVNGPRATKPFIALNCAAIPKELLASELFGYESGAFTGAKLKGKPGKFQQANRGTIYLDEVGDMPLDLQAYLLRVIEEKKVTRLGGTESIPIDVQIIASTNCNLKKLVKEGKFRLDLYYRLDVITLVIPPLRERKDDIRPLAEFFLEKVREKLDGVKKRLSPQVLDALHDYNWPGNVRELEHVIEMAHAISNGDIIGLADLREDIFCNSFCWSENLVSGNQTNIEGEKIKMTIKMCDGNMSKAARTLDISRTTLYRKLMKYGIPVKVKDVDAPYLYPTEGKEV